MRRYGNEDKGESSLERRKRVSFRGKVGAEEMGWLKFLEC
jgi:hypothetical protein